MKKTVLIILSLMFSVATFAQQQLATLNHNDNVSVFYGTTALQQAYDSAVNGDVIMLSSGAYNSITIKKAITIRGNGMIRDTIAGTEPTIINGCTFADPDSASNYNLAIEGVRFSSSTRFRAISNPNFTKCMFETIDFNGAEHVYNATFLNCIIRYYYAYNLYNSQFINSIINLSSWNSSHGCSLRNCISYLNPSTLTQSSQNVPDLTCTNSILISNGNYSSVDPLACFNCIGIGENDFFSNSNNSNQNFSNLSTVFKYFSGLQSSYLPMETDFDLQDSIATNVLGNDGTQVGVYGGMVPFTPRVNTPRYVRCNVAPHTTPDGKLSVDVEVVSE